MSNNYDFDIFNNPMVNAARKGMSKDDLDRYKEWGEAMYDGIDYETISVSNYPPPMINALAYINESLKAGQHPSTLTEEEQKLLEEMEGKEWYKKWGYVEGDLTDIITIKKD
jgi:hypothetical protein